MATRCRRSHGFFSPLNQLDPHKNSFLQFQTDAADFLMKLLVFDPGKRLTAETALKHNYIQRSPDEEIFLSSAVNQAVMFTSRSEGHRRLPYTKQMNPSPRPRAPDSPEPRGSGRSTITLFDGEHFD
uniref:Protein kinase domain-containing protein n=1 Tax=Ciona savignyi TaxID=51511 RepID=H2YTA2_CIOSA